MSVLHSKVRKQVKKDKWTRLLIIDSQAVKNTCNASTASKGYCFTNLQTVLKDILPLIPWDFLSLLTVLKQMYHMMQVEFK